MDPNAIRTNKDVVECNFCGWVGRPWEQDYVYESKKKGSRTVKTMCPKCRVLDTLEYHKEDDRIFHVEHLSMFMHRGKMYFYSHEIYNCQYHDQEKRGSFILGRKNSPPTPLNSIKKTGHLSWECYAHFDQKDEIRSEMIDNIEDEISIMERDMYAMRDAFNEFKGEPDKFLQSRNILSG